jgi:hypothetical protein
MASSAPQSRRVAGIPYAQNKTRGRTAGCREWTAAVVAATEDMRPVDGPCRVRVVFRLPGA